MKTSATVMNVLTEDKLTYYNGSDLISNLVSAIIYTTEDASKILHSDYRKKIELEAKIEKINSINGTVKYYSPAYDMIAYESHKNN
jgi:hypothetical protein